MRKYLTLLGLFLIGCNDGSLHYIKEIKPEIIVHPQVIDFGHLISGQETGQDRVTVINAGNSELFLDEFLLDDPNGRYTLTYEETEVLQPEEILDITIDYIPETYETNPATISIISNDEESSHIDVEITGWGDAPILKVFPEDSDLGQLFIGCDTDDQITFMNLGNLDLVIEDITQLTSIPQEIYIDYGSLPVFPWNLIPGEFYKVGVDYNMAVITTDRYNFTQIITDQDTNAVTLLAQSVVTGTYGSGIERGIQMAYESLSDPNYAGPGGNFFRQDAKLVVIFVSDEPDHSYSTWTSYTTFFDQLKPAGYFIPFGIIGDPPSGCGGGGWQGAMYGAGYYELINHYGGSWYSICETDWGTQMQSLGNQVVTQSRFSLSEDDPVEDTISVFVDGQQLEEGWSYDSNTNQIVFEATHIPEPGETIRVEYALWGC
jgi:hypothetical protein